MESNNHTYQTNTGTMPPLSPMCIAGGESWGSAITAVAGVSIILGNLLVIAVLVKFPSKKFRPLNWLILQLATADILVGLSVIYIGTIVPNLPGKQHLIWGIVSYGALASFTSMSTVGVLYIAMDRYFFILSHSQYKSIVTKTRLKVAIVIAAVVPMSVFLLAPLSGWNCIDRCDCNLYNANPTQQYCMGQECSQMMTPFKKTTLLVGGSCLLVLLIVSIGLYVRIFVSIQKHTRRVSIASVSSAQQKDSSQHPHQQPTKMRRAQMRMVKTMVIVLLGFVLTTGPLAMCCVASYFVNVRKLHTIMRTIVVISTFNSIMNPFFYFWRIPDMTHKLKLMTSGIQDCLLCNGSAEERRDNRRRSLGTVLQYSAGRKLDTSSLGGGGPPQKQWNAKPNRAAVSVTSSTG